MTPIHSYLYTLHSYTDSYIINLHQLTNHSFEQILRLIHPFIYTYTEIMFIQLCIYHIVRTNTYTHTHTDAFTSLITYIHEALKHDNIYTHDEFTKNTLENLNNLYS